MAHKKIDSFNDVDKYLDYRIKKVQQSKSLAWEDSWQEDKKWQKNNIDGFFDCKFCAKPLYTHTTSPGSINVSCKTPLCPGNADSGMANEIGKHQFDIRELTNQYLFDSMLRF